MPQELIALLIAYKYWILLPLSIIEGPIVAVIVGFLSTQGYFNFFTAYLFLVTLDFLTDIAYFSIGQRAQEKKFLDRYYQKIHFSEAHMRAMKHLWHMHTFKTVFLSKLAYGLSTILLMSAGLSGLSFSRFARQSLAMCFFQYAIFMIAGYYFGTSFTLLKTTFDIIGISTAVMVIVLIVIGYVYVGMKAKKFFRNPTKDISVDTVLAL